MPECTDDGIGTREVTQLAALNETLRDDYTEDCLKGMNRWNRALDKAGVAFNFELPHVGFHRQVGTFRDFHVSPDGRVIDEDTWNANVDAWLPSDADRAHVKSLMTGVTEPGKMAGWVAPPATGIHQQPVEYEYVRL